MQYSTDGGRTWELALDGTSGATRTLLTGLPNGVAHTFRVAAVVNGVLGAFSRPTAALMPFDRNAKPAAPANPRGVALGRGIYSLQWDAVARNDGGPVTDYVIQYRVNSATSRWTTARDAVSANASATLQRLTARQGYVFRIAAKNQAGLGGFSREITVQ